MKSFANFVLLILIVMAALTICASAQPHPEVVLETNYLDITIELFPDDAPITVDNFLNYVNSGFYDGILFHRIIPDFMIQAGGYYFQDNQFQKRTPNANIINEGDNGISNLRGTVSMALSTGPNTGNSGFFINQVNNTGLDTVYGIGHCVFGQVSVNLTLVDSIAQAPDVDLFPGEDAFDNLPYPLISIFRAYVKPRTAPSESNFVDDDQIDMKDINAFALRWHDDCNSANSFCNGIDLDYSGTVDNGDLKIFVNNYLGPVTP